MTVKYLKIDDIVENYNDNIFYICSISFPTNGSEESLYSDMPPCKAYIKYNHFDLASSLKICLEDGKELNRNRYFVYMVSEQKEDLELEYKRIKCEWIKIRKKYLLDELDKIEKMEKECF